MPVTQSRPEDDSKKTFDYSILPPIDTNAILSRIIQRLPSGKRNAIILRCDDLPQISAPEANVFEAFSALIELITGRREKKTLYLYIFSTTVKTAFEKTERLLFHFNTNLAPDEWLESDNQKVNNIAALLTPFGGSVTINQLKNSGCIFILSLPGKQ